jgi:hypothetical protein
VDKIAFGRSATEQEIDEKLFGIYADLFFRQIEQLWELDPNSSRTFLGLLALPGHQEFWRKNKRVICKPGFRSFIDNMLAESA